MTALVRYEAACYAIQIAWQIDEVKDIRDKALAMQAYARQAKNTKMIEQATEIKLRAERKVGELLNGSERNKGAAAKQDALPSAQGVPPTLAEIGLTEKQSSDFQALAAIPEEKFEKELKTGKATTKSLVRTSPKRKRKAAAAKTPKPKKSPEAKKPTAGTVTMAEYDEVVQELEALKERCQDLTDELKTAVAVMGTDAAIEMQKLREELRYANRKKNELMARTVEMEKQIKFWRKTAEKLGWKPEKRTT